MYGLLSSAYNDYRINNSTNSRESFWTKKQMKQYLSWPARGMYSILEIILTVVALLCLWDCYLVQGWDSWLLVLLLVLFFIPYLGDCLALVIVVYWLLEVRPNSEILSKIKV
jgi:hypothetical protein